MKSHGMTEDITDGTIDFVYEGDQCVEEYAGSTLLRQYVWGQYIDELVQQREYEHKPEERPYIDYYPLTDLLHRTVALTDDELCEGGSPSIHRNNIFKSVKSQTIMV